jgi:hypothetical protein
VEERNWRSRWTAEKEAKKTKKNEGKKPQTEKKKYTQRETTYF